MYTKLLPKFEVLVRVEHLAFFDSRVLRTTSALVLVDPNVQTVEQAVYRQVSHSSNKYRCEIMSSTGDKSCLGKVFTVGGY